MSMDNMKNDIFVALIFGFVFAILIFINYKFIDF